MKFHGVNISKLNTLSIPRLAQGGFVKANTPRLAVIGDNRREGEIVAPEGKMMEMVMTALKMFKEQDTHISNEDLTIENNIILDGELIQRSLQKRGNRMNLATNGRCS